MQPARSKSNEDILAIAALHFSRKGYAGARIDEIALDAQVNKATLYYRIGDKQVLYHTILNKALEILLAAVMVQVGNQTKADEKLKAHILAIAQSMETHPHFAALVMREIASGSENMPEGALARMNAVREILMNILKQGRDDGIFLSIDPLLIHMQIMGTLLFYSVGQPIPTKLNDVASNEAGPWSAMTEAAEGLTHSLLLALKHVKK